MRHLIVLSFVAAVFVFCGASIPNGYASTSEDRARRVEQMIKNDARQIGASAHQYFLEHREAKNVVFGVNTGTWQLTGPLHQWCSRLTRGIRVIQGKIDGWDGTFTLQHEEAFGGKPVVFDCNGKIITSAKK